jgi:cytidine deaminase
MSPDPQRSELLKAAAGVSRHAHAPYSTYKVGAAVRTASGRVYVGCNVENASYGLTLCAERAAVAAAIAAGEREIVEVAVVASGPSWPSPCGACRQVLAEFAKPEVRIHMARRGRLAEVRTATMGALLPESFAFAAPRKVRARAR